MLLSHVIERVYYNPMLITAEGHKSITDVIEAKLRNGNLSLKAAKKKAEEDETDLFGEPLPMPYDIRPGVRVIPVNGPIGYRVGGLGKLCGICDIGSVNKWSREAERDATIHTVLYDFNTPGGEITNVMETAAVIEKLGKKKKTIGYTDTMACSAGMWLYAACDETYHTDTANLMSVGVYSYMLDYSEQLASLGIKTEAFVSGDLKGIGIPGKQLTDAQRKYLQDEVENLGTLFRNYMKKRMPKVPDDMMRGQSVYGFDVAKHNVTTGIVTQLEDIFE